MSELQQVKNELIAGWNKVSNKNKRMTILIVAQLLLCGLTLAYCIIGRYHQYFKGLICLLCQLSITASSYVVAAYKVNPVTILYVNSIVLFVFVHIMTRNWAYLTNDHDIINDPSY